MLGQLLAGLFVASIALAAPVLDGRQATTKCANPPLRRSWHRLSDVEKKSYIDAELCLMTKPATLGLRGARSKFDELQSIHVYQSEIAHFVGQFFPFHRLYIWAHEQALRKECGYTGAQPYWDESLDAGEFTKSIIFDADLGFGGDGFGNTSCIQTSPFANYMSPIGPGYRLSDHCIERRISDFASKNASTTTIDGCLAKKTYLEFWDCVEGAPHGAGHAGVGAQMVNPISSPGDPIFYLHHAWLDRIWARWQAMDPVVRLKEIGGNNRASGTPLAPPPGFDPGLFIPGFDPKDFIRPDDVPEPLIIGDAGSEVTLTHLIQMYGAVPDQTVAEVMDIQGDVLCYVYD